MWEFQHRVRRLIAGMMTRHPKISLRRSEPGAAADWLPPVLGPNDWSIGLMADHSADWYFERR